MSGVEQAANKANKSLKNLGDGADKGLNAVGTAAPRAEQSLGRVAKNADEAKRSIAEMNRSASGLSAALRGDHLVRGFSGIETGATAAASAVSHLNYMLALTGAGISINSLIGWSDGYTKLTAQLRNATDSAQDYAYAMEQVKRISEGAQAGIGELGVLYARIASSTKELGVSQAQVAKITETVALSLKANGASAAEASSAMLQLSQAFGSGVLRGEEFNAVYEAAPNLLRNLADAMGVPQGKLREMASDGKLTAEVLAKYLPESLEKVRKEAERMATIGGAFTVLNNKIMEFVGEANQASGAAKAISGGIVGLANNLDTVATAAGVVALVMAGRYTASMATAAAASVAAATAAVQHQIAMARTAAAIGGYSATTTAGLVAMTGAARAASLAMGALGGPVGLAVTAIGLGAAAFYSFGDSADVAKEKVVSLLDPLDELTAKLSALPAEKRVAVTLDLKEEQQRAVEAADAAVDALIQSVGDLTNMRLPAGEWNALRDRVEAAAKSGQDLTPILAAAANSASLPEQHLNKWLQLAGNLRVVQKEAAEAANKLAAITGAAGAGGGRGSVNPKTTVEAAAERWVSQQFLAQRNNGITKQFAADIEGLAKAYANGALSATEYARAVTEANIKRYESTEAGKAEAKAAKDGAKGNKEGESAILSYIKSLEARTAAQRLEIAQGDKLTESQRARIQLEALLADSKNKASKSQVANAQALLAESEANEAWLKNASDVEKALADMQKAREQSLQSVQDSVKKLVEDAEAAAYAETHNISLAEAVERLALARAENAYQQAVERQEAPATLDALEAELQARKKIVELTAQKGVREANQKAQDQIAKDWERVSQTIGDTLADYIMGGGKDAAQYLKRLFATLVLQPVVNYGVQGVMGALGMGQTGAAAGSVLRGNNVGTTILNNAGAIGAGFQAMYGMSVGASSASLVAANAVGMVGGDALGTLIAGNGAWAGVAVEAGATAGAAAGAAAAEGAAAGAAGAAQAGGFMSGVAAAAPWVAGAAALYSIIKSFDDSGTPHTGAGAIYKDGAVSGGKSIFNGANFNFGAKWSEQAQSSVTAIAGGLGSALDSVATAFGNKAGYSIYTAFADDSSGDGAWGSLKIADAMGNVLTDWEQSRSSKWAPKTFADGEEGYKQYLAAAALDVKSAMLAMDLPAWADNILAAATDLDTLNAALSQIAVNKAGFDALAASMSMFKGISEELQTQLLATAGSMDALASVAGSYYGSSLFSEQERMLAARQQQMDALSAMGLSIDPAQGEQAKAAFRSTVEQAMAAGQGELAVKLMAMSASFAQVADYAQQAMADADDAARQAQQAMADVEKAAKDAADAARQAQQGLMQSAAQVLAAMPGGADEARYVQSRLLAEQAAQIWGQGAEQLQGIILQSSAADIEGYLREAWSYLDTTEAKQALVDLGGQLLEFASQADQAAAQQRGAALAGAWGTLASISGLAAQYTGNAAGLNAQLAVMQGSYAAADNPADRLAALQEVITLEQSIWGLQQKQRQSEAQAIQEGIKAAQEQLNAQQDLLRAAQSLGEFASDLFSSEQSGLSTAERQAALQSEYQVLLARAQGGDADAMGQLQGVSRDYLQLAQKTASSEADYSVLSGMVAAQLASVSAISQASATSQTQRLEDQIKLSQQQADALSAAQFAVSDQTRVAIESLLTESIGGFDDQLRSMQDLSDLTEQQLTALKQWPAALNGIMSATLVPSIQGIAQSASSSAVSAYVAANAAAEEQRMRRAAELVADQLRQQLAAAQAAAEAAAKAAIASASVAGVTVPAFAAGGLHSGGVRLVGEYGPELEVTGPARYFNAQQTQQMLSGGGNAELVAENRRLQQRVAYLQAHMERVANATERLADMFENVSAGGNSMAVDVMRMRASLVEAV